MRSGGGGLGTHWRCVQVEASFGTRRVNKRSHIASVPDMLVAALPSNEIEMQHKHHQTDHTQPSAVPLSN